jgi:hypothetical protein
MRQGHRGRRLERQVAGKTCGSLCRYFADTYLSNRDYGNQMRTHSNSSICKLLRRCSILQARTAALRHFEDCLDTLCAQRRTMTQTQKFYDTDYFRRCSIGSAALVSLVHHRAVFFASVCEAYLTLRLEKMKGSSGKKHAASNCLK